MTETIAAIVVTYNRKLLLEKCLKNILKQTHTVDKIFVIDNASIDGTQEYLRQNHYLDYPKITYIKLSENIGGAGGFHQGMICAYHSNYDWFWLMDDDGYPSLNCLEILLKNSQEIDIINPTVVTPEDHECLTWGIRTFNKNGKFRPRGFIYQYQDLVNQSSQGIYKGFANFFNATLINRSVVDKIGYIIPELFCWGDELEYFLRCREANLKIATCTTSYYYHPRNLPQLSKLRYYYFIRNTFYNYCKYNNLYPNYIKWFYPLYILLKYIPYIPSFSIKYVSAIRIAIINAIQGQLVPYYDLQKKSK